MKPISQKTHRTFYRLIDGLTEENRSRRIDNTGGAFMPVSVEFLQSLPCGDVYSITHYYEQNGDLMSDPDMTFLVAPGIVKIRGRSVVADRVYPLTYRQDGLGINQDAVVWENGKIKGVRQKMQRSMATFASQWMENIRQQQFGRKAVTA